jgi:hypothetical protein
VGSSRKVYYNHFYFHALMNGADVDAYDSDDGAWKKFVGDDNHIQYKSSRIALSPVHGLEFLDPEK